MKNKNLRNLFIGAVVVVAGVGVAMYSCEKENITPAEEVTGEVKELQTVLPNDQHICSPVQEKNIIRPNKEKVGTAYIYNDPEKMYVLLFGDEGHFFRDAYLEDAASVGELPMNSDGNLAFGDFSYQIAGKAMSNVRRFVLPIGKLEGKYFSVVAQVRHTRYNGVKERAWIQGRLVGNTEKGHVFIYEPKLCKTPASDIPAEEAAAPAPGAHPGKVDNPVEPVKPVKPVQESPIK